MIANTSVMMLPMTFCCLCWSVMRRTSLGVDALKRCCTHITTRGGGKEMELVAKKEERVIPTEENVRCCEVIDPSGDKAHAAQLK